jgi:hypothetical protein
MGTMADDMDMARRERLEAELAEVQRERERLDTVIAYLTEKLGMESPIPDSTLDAAPEPTGGAVGKLAEPSTAITEGGFFGMSAPKAAVILLERVGRTRPLKTKEIYNAIRKGGVNIGNPNTLHRSLTRDDRFYRVGRGLWGLSAWYPGQKPKAAEASSPNAANEPEPDQTQESHDEAPEEGAA